MSNVIPFFISVFLGFFVFQFYYWRRLREDYSAQLLFTSGLYMVVGVVVGSIVGLMLKTKIGDSMLIRTDGFWFWGAAIGYFAGLGLSVHKLHLRISESFEASAIGMLLWLMGISVVYGMLMKDIVAIGMSALSLALVLLFYFLESRYRRFTWYKSGRVGFSGLVVLTIYFLFRLIIAFTVGTGFTIVGKSELIPSSVAVFLLVFSLYNLSER